MNKPLTQQLRWMGALAALFISVSPHAMAQSAADAGRDAFGAGQSTEGLAPAGAVRLRQPQALARDWGDYDEGASAALRAKAAPYVPGEFEQYARTQSGNLDLKRFGAELLNEPASNRGEAQTAVPPDYTIRPGDEISLTLWGSVDADLRLNVDRTGKISIPRIGAVQVAGVRHADLADVIARRVSTVFRNFQIAATLGQIKGVRVFVTGYAHRPGSLTVSGLSSVLHVLVKAGGPSAAGSFRDIQLRRGGQVVAKLDLYDILIHGDRKADQIVQADDVIHISPVGPQVAIVGSVNLQAVFELKPKENLSDALRMAGGFNAVADRTRVAVERLEDRATGRVAEMRLPENGSSLLGAGDLVRAFSSISAALPKDKQRKRVKVEGEVVSPGEYILPAGSTVSDAVKAAGGLTNAAYVFGTEFSRESVRQQQQDNYDKALRDLETEMAKTQASQRVSTGEEVAAQTNSTAANARLIERLRLVRPTGRVVLQIAPDAKELPNLALEDGDRLHVPSQSTSVGVFGSVFNAGSFIYASGSTTGDFLKLAGGPTRGADARSMFVVRANGSVVSARQGASFWGSGVSGFETAALLPGDTIFVPEELNKTTLTQDAKDWTQILYQFGLGLAGIKALGI